MTEPHYYKLHLCGFSEELFALVVFKGAYTSSHNPLFETVHIFRPAHMYFYLDELAVGDLCYSSNLTSLPIRQIQTTIHNWIHKGVEAYHGPRGSGYAGEEALNAELTPIPSEVAALLLQKIDLQKQLADVSAQLEAADPDSLCVGIDEKSF